MPPSLVNINNESIRRVHSLYIVTCYIPITFCIPFETKVFMTTAFLRVPPPLCLIVCIYFVAMCVNVHCNIVVDVFLTSENISTYYVVVYIGQDRYVLLHVDSILIIFSSFLSRKYKFCLTRLCPNPTFVEHIASNSSSSINTQIVREIHPLLCNIIISAAFQSHQILLWSC